MRCFLAIELPEETRDRLADLQDRLSHLGRSVRWTRPGHVHLTVKFFGDVPDQDVPAICDLAATITQPFEPFELSVRGTGCFPPHGPARIIWAGLAELPQPLLDCQQACEDQFAEMGYPPEGRLYHPHLTIGRVRDARRSRQTRQAIEAEANFDGGIFHVEELLLFQSVLECNGPTYTVIARAPLGASPPRQNNNRR